MHTASGGVPDSLISSVLRFLHSHEALCHVQHTDFPPLALRELHRWEAREGVTLPSDVRASLQLADGFQLRWSIRIKDDVLPLGHLHINTLSQWRRVSWQQGTDLHVPRLRICGPHYSPSEEPLSEDEDADDDGSSTARSPPPPPFPRLYDVDSSCPAGHVCLLFTSPTHCSGVYFIDLACSAYFIAPTLTHYFRLMLMHVGIPYWQYAYTDEGMPQSTEQWFHFLSPHRLAIDLAHARAPRIAQERAAARSDAKSPKTSRISTSRADARRPGSAAAAAVRPGTGTGTGGASASVTPAPAPLDLSKIESLAQSILALTPKVKRARSASRRATAEPASEEDANGA